MKKVLSLFALCAMFAFAGCAKKKDEAPRATKKENMKKDHHKKDSKKKEKKCKACNAKPCKCKKDTMKKSHDKMKKSYKDK